MKSKFKIKTLAAKPTDFELVHPVHKETGIMISMRGPHSKEWREAFDKYKDDEKNGSLELMVAAIVGWDEDAFELPCTPENVKTVLADPVNEWIAQEVVRHLWDVSAFFSAGGGAAVVVPTE